MNELDPLRQIARVDPPPFLLTRVKALVAEEQRGRRWALALVCASVALLLLNMLFVFDGATQLEANDLESLGAEFQLYSSNQLYHD